MRNVLRHFAQTHKAHPQTVMEKYKAVKTFLTTTPEYTNSKKEMLKRCFRKGMNEKRAGRRWPKRVTNLCTFSHQRNNKGWFHLSDRSTLHTATTYGLKDLKKNFQWLPKAKLTRSKVKRCHFSCLSKTRASPFFFIATHNRASNLYCDIT